MFRCIRFPVSVSTSVFLDVRLLFLWFGASGSVWGLVLKGFRGLGVKGLGV